MRKKTMTTLIFLTVAFYVLAFLIGLSSSSDVATGVSNFFVLLGLMTWLPAWIGGLYRQARQHQWGWFVGTILFGVLALSLYVALMQETPAYPQYRRPDEYSQPQPHEETAYHYEPRVDQEVERQVETRQYQEMVPPASYQEAMQPEFYQQARSSEVTQEQER